MKLLRDFILALLMVALISGITQGLIAFGEYNETKEAQR